MLTPSLKKNGNYIINIGRDKGVHAFQKSLTPNVNVIA